MVKADLSRDYYADLELPPTADANEIKKQFKKLALKYHPDRNIGRESEVNAKFQKIQSAHEVLTDTEQRAKYDAGRSRSRAFGSGFGSGMNAQRGNPYANAGAQWAPPPKRNTAARPTAPPPPSAGAAKFKKFETPGSSYRTPQEGAESRQNTYQAWEKMRPRADPAKPAYGPREETGPGKSWATPKAPPKEYTPQSGREESNNMKHSAPPRARPGYEEFRAAPPPMPHRSQSTKRAGFMPSDPTGDEPQAATTSAYTRNRRSQGPIPHDIPPPPPRPPVVDPLRSFREKVGAAHEPRMSTPYSTHGGEKTNPFESPNVNRSRSTREHSSSHNGPFSPSGSSDRHRSASPPRSQRSRPPSSADFVPRTDSDPSLSRQHPPSGTRPSYRPQHNPKAEADSTSSDDGPSSVDPRIKTREFAKARAKRTTPSRRGPGDAQNSKQSPPSVKEFQKWWSSGAQGYPDVDVLKSEQDLQGKSQAGNAQQPMYAHPFESSLPSKASIFQNPTVLASSDEHHHSKAEATATARAQAESAVKSFSSRYFNQSDPFSSDRAFSDHIHPETPPSGVPAHCLNPFEIQQRSILDNLIQKPRTNYSPSDHTRQSTGTASQTVPESNDPNPKHRFFFDSNDGTAERPSLKTFTSNSTDSINTKFSAQDWHGKFEAGDYFTAEQKSANMPPGRARSGSQSRGRSPTKSKQGNRPNIQTSQIPDLEPSAAPQTPSASPGGTRFSAEEWEATFKPQTFAPPPHPSPGVKPAYSRKQSRTQKGPTTRPTMGSAAVVEESSDSADEKPLFMGRRQSKVNVTSNSSNANSRPPTGAVSPNAMDIDVEIPATPSVVYKEEAATSTNIATDGQPRNVPLEPSRPEWRDTNERTEIPSTPDGQPNLPPRSSPSKGKRRATKSTDSDGFGAINLETLKNAEPIKQGSQGLNGFEDLAATLPFPSQAASRVPIAKSPKTGDLDLPKPPRAPDTPSMATANSWLHYLSAFKTYMVDWDLFNCRMVAHFQARRNQVQSMGSGWLEAVGDEPCLSYMEGVAEDQRVRKWWSLTSSAHEESMRIFMNMRERMKNVPT
ncbi:DnaJ domain-containing protein [Phlyctema vagabunda]|uniref:DnaJ domain-containing protein n=1 Tax=Phlyctema vagabunda TaxID=108571 RepID=A0ABR4PVU1_9HELO